MSSWPDFFIIGAMKSGTTTLYDYLNSHQDICMCQPKEPGYFSRSTILAKGEDWYKGLFKSESEAQLKGDASTCYSRHKTYPGVPSRIFEVAPNAKFIYIVRNPVERAYSHYGHEMQRSRIAGRDIVSYKEAIEKDIEMLEAGLYAEQIKEYLRFFDISQFMFVGFDDLKSKPDKVAAEVMSFLSVSPSVRGTEVIVNNGAGSNYARKELDKKLRAIKSIPGLGLLIDTLPQSLRRNVFEKIRKIIRVMGGDKALAQQHIKTISKPDEEDNKFLYEYYKEDTENFIRMTGLDLSCWKNYYGQ